MNESVTKAADSIGYTTNFYRGLDDRSLYSARTILSLLLAAIPPVKSAVDYGCGVGTWLAEARRQGIDCVRGYEGEWLDRSLLEIDQDSFDYLDFNHLNNAAPSSRYDLALCLEVAEHLPPDQADKLISLLVASADFILFSAAIPDQGGKGHLNERWPDHWAHMFRAHGYVVFAPFRRELWSDPEIRPWYRQNLLVCVKKEAIKHIRLSEFDRDMPVLPVIHPEIFQTALDKKQAQINALKTRAGAWRALRHAIRYPHPDSQPAGTAMHAMLSEARYQELMATVPLLSRRQIRKQQSRYYRWRMLTAAYRSMKRPRRLPDSPELKDFAITLIALRPRYRRWALTLIASLRAAGEYTGPIYVVTEQPEDFAQLNNVEPIRVAATRHQLVAKTCKTFLADWVPQRYVLYIDADILVGRPITQWCRAGKALSETRAALFYPDPSERQLPFHGGLILINSQLAKPLLHEWRQCLASGRYRQDQEALLSFGRTHAVGDLPPGGLVFPDSQMIENKSSACFVHLTSYRYRLLGHDSCLRYLQDVLKLSEASANQRLDFS